MAAGRPKIELTEKEWQQAERMANIQCTGSEIANVLGMHYDTLELKIRERGYTNFSEWYTKYSDVGKMALRRKQFKLADRSAAMSIFLGKNYLKQKDKSEQEIEHKGGITLAYNLDYEPKEILVGSNSEQLEDKTDKKGD